MSLPALFAGAAIMLLAVSAKAAVVETTYSTWDIFAPGNTTTHFEVRAGDQAPGGAWEVGVKDGDALLPGPGNTDHLTWNNDGNAVSFSLTHSSVTGDLVFAIGGVVLTWDLDPADSYAKISILAKSADVAGLVVTIGNLQLDGNPLTNDSLIAGQATRSGVFLTGEVFSDFTLTGDVDFAWSGGSPNPAELQMFVGVEAVPLPAAAWLFLSAIALLGYRGRTSA